MRSRRLICSGILGCVLSAWMTLCGAAADKDSEKKKADDSHDPPAAKLAKQFDGGKRWAVIISVNKYEDPEVHSLRFCVADGELFAEALSQKCGYPKENILMMTDNTGPNLLPTKANMQQHTARWLKKAKEGDTVVVYFSGHGDVIRGECMLDPRDMDHENPGLSMFRMEELRSMLHDCNATQKLLVLDCCHSGGGKAGLGLSGQDLEGAKGAGGLITFAGCRKSQSSQESGKLKHGVFTYCLARGLSGEADANKDGIVDSDELYHYLYENVSAEVHKMDPNLEQQPVRIIGEDVLGVFALARVSGEPLVTPPVEIELKIGEKLSNSLGMKLALVPQGKFRPGSPPNEAGRNDDERKTYEVKFANPILMGAHEVTQAQFQKVMGTNPSYFCKAGGGADDVTGKDTSDFPVEQVTWDEAADFCRKLSRLPAEKSAKRMYRLPTELEWEYACRAGTTTPFHVGELLASKDANVDGDRPYLNSPAGPNLKRTTTVGSFKPNAWGLYDMHGNVWEWCLDWYTDTPDYLNCKAGPEAGQRRLLRGGGFTGDVALARSASRRGRDPDYRNKSVGFRVVCEFGEIGDKK